MNLNTGPGRALRQSWQIGGPALIGAAAAVVFVTWGSGETAPAPDPGRSPHPAVPAQPYQLYTHCGISEARIGGGYYQAARPLSDGQGNPPPGWGNPYQPGTVTRVSPRIVVFRDGAGHVVRFRLRPGATAFQQVCG